MIYSNNYMMKSRIKTAVYNLSNSFRKLLMKCDLVCLAFLMKFVGGMLIIGEWLCMEVAWRCMDYNPIILAVSITLLLSGLISLFMGIGLRYAK